MKVTYDPEADAIFIGLKTGKYGESDHIAPNVILNFDDAGKVLSIEILQARSVMGIQDPLAVEVHLLGKMNVKASVEIPTAEPAPQSFGEQADTVR
jgi:uncharacterized protein YuzE